MKTSKYLFVILASTVILFGAIARVSFLNVSKRTPDEKVYALYATEILTTGPLGLVNLIDAYRADAKLWVYPPPTRAGYIYALAAFSKITNLTPDAAGSLLSALCSVLALALFVRFGVGAAGRRATLFGLLLLAASPMDLAVARRCWQESVMGILSLLIFVVAISLLKKSFSKRRWAFYTLLLFVAVFMKETGFFLVISITGICAAVSLFRKEYRAVRAYIASAAVSVILWGLFFWVSAGNPLASLSLLADVKHSIGTNAYALANQSGGATHFIRALYALSPASCLLFFAGIYYLFRGAETRVKLAAVYFFSWIAFYLFVGHSVNLRYLSVGYFAYFLLAGYGFARASSRYKGVILVLAVGSVLIFAAVDYANFVNLFVRRGALDLTPQILIANSIYSSMTVM